MNVLLLLLTATTAFALPPRYDSGVCGMACGTSHDYVPTGEEVSMISTAAPSVSDTVPNTRWLSTTQKVRGVNLGSQFVMEPWMTYDEFNSMGCGGLEDEWSCVQHLGQEAANAAFARHWDTWITQDDITKIATLGLNVVRIPVGFWIKEELVWDGEYYPRGGLAYLDRLVGWAADAGLYVILDLHAGPGVQARDQQFTGHKTTDPQFYNSSNYERAVEFLEWITARIHTQHHYRSTGILQVLNEPVSKTDFPNEAASMIQNFYPEAYNRIRATEQSLGVTPEQELQVQYMSKTWGSGDPTKYLPKDARNIMFDDHRYYSFGDDAPTSKQDVMRAASRNSRGGKSTIVGEWSLSVKEGVADLVNDKDWYRSFWLSQVLAYEQTAGWIFWTWKCNWVNGQDEWRWCYESAVANGVIPENITEAISKSSCQ